MATSVGDKIGDISRMRRHGETYGCAAAYGRAVSGPMVEGEARVVCGCQSTSLALLVLATAAYRTAIARVGGNGNSVSRRNVCEVRHQSPVAVHGKGIIGLGRNHSTAFRPVGEGVVAVGHGIYRARLALVIRACDRACGAAHVRRTAIARVDGNADGVIFRLCFKVSHQGTVVRHGEGVFGFSGNHMAAIHPINKGEIRIGRGGHSAGFPLLVEATPRHRTAVSRVGRNIDGINPSKVGHKFAIAGNMEIISGIVCNYTIISVQLANRYPELALACTVQYCPLL